MSEMKAHDGTNWQSIFQPKYYGLNDDGGGVANQFNNFNGVIKVYTGGNWVIVWPPGADGQSSGIVTITLPSFLTVSAFNINATSTSRVIFKSGGNLQRTIDGGAEQDTNPVSTWLSSSPTGIGSNYEIKCTYTGITPTAHNFTDLVGSWVSCNIDRYIEITDPTPGTSANEAVLTITIRETGNAATEVSGTITLSAFNNNGA